MANLLIKSVDACVLLAITTQVQLKLLPANYFLLVQLKLQSGKHTFPVIRLARTTPIHDSGDC